MGEGRGRSAFDAREGEVELVCEGGVDAGSADGLKIGGRGGGEGGSKMWREAE